MILLFDVLLIQNANGLAMLLVFNTILSNNAMILNFSFMCSLLRQKKNDLPQVSDKVVSSCMHFFRKKTHLL